MTDFENAFGSKETLLLEGAIGERLKREYGIAFDPYLDMGALVRDAYARNALCAIWSGYAETAYRYGLPFLATTTTRRTNKARLAKTSYDELLYRDNVAFLKEVRDRQRAEMYVGALVGCFGEAYTGAGCLDRESAHAFHSFEAEHFAKENIDFFMAGLMPTIEEATGMAMALSDTGVPYIISFTLKRNGCLPDGTKLCDAIKNIDDTTEHRPVCYMANCVHPKIVLQALNQPFNNTGAVRERFLGIQANASLLDFEKLDGAKELHSSAPMELAREVKNLAKSHHLKLFGGCCGTDGRHLEEIAKAVTEKS